MKRFEAALYAPVAFLFYALLQFQAPFLSDGDAYFHIKIASLWLDRGPIRALPWMADSIHAGHYVDYHFLYHAALVPFAVLFDDLEQAAKWSAACFAALSLSSFVLLLRVGGARARWFWALCWLCASPIFTGRLMFGRGTVLFLGLLFLFFCALRTDRIRSAGVLAGLAVWTYPGFPLLLIFSFLFFLFERAKSGRWRPRTALIPFGAATLAFLVHPGLPHQFHAYWLELVVHSLGPPGLEGIGEWQPPESGLAALALAIPGTLFLVASVAGGPHDAFQAALGTLGLVLACAFALAFKPLEFLVPVLLACAGLRGTTRLPARVQEAGLALTIVALLAWALPDLFARTRDQFRFSSPASAFAAADWLERHTRADSLVLLDWDRFPLFFFRNTRNRYPFGLNPVYAYGADPVRYRTLREFFQGQGDPPADAPYAVLETTRHGPAIERLTRSGAPRVYANAEFVIFRLCARPGCLTPNATP